MSLLFTSETNNQNANLELEYLSNEMSDEWNICVLFVETVFDVSHNRYNKASAEQMHHAIKDWLFKLQLQCLNLKNWDKNF